MEQQRPRTMIEVWLFQDGLHKSQVLLIQRGFLEVIEEETRSLGRTTDFDIAFVKHENPLPENKVVIRVTHTSEIGQGRILEQGWTFANDLAIATRKILGDNVKVFCSFWAPAQSNRIVWSNTP